MTNDIAQLDFTSTQGVEDEGTRGHTEDKKDSSDDDSELDR